SGVARRRRGHRLARPWQGRRRLGARGANLRGGRRRKRLRAGLAALLRRAQGPVCTYLRIVHGRIEMTSQVTAPDVIVLMNDAAADEVDFAEGTNGALFRKRRGQR